MRYFLKAKRIWAKDHLDELNSNLIFYTNFPKRDSVKLIIAGNNVFSIYLNGKLVHYGPTRAAHDRYRVDELTFNELKNKNHLVIFVNGSNANTFYTLNTKPFLHDFEIVFSHFYANFGFKFYFPSLPDMIR